MNREELMQDVLLGQSAIELLDSEAFKAACASAEKEIFQQWISANLPDQREAMWHRLQALKTIQAKLRTLMSNKDMADRKLKE